MKIVLKILLTIVVITIILSYVGIEKFTKGMKMINIQLFFTAFLLFPLVAIIGSIKWQRIIRHEAVGIKYRDALVSFLGGMSLGLLTPGRVGEFGRVAFISEGHMEALIGIAAVDKIIDLEVTLFLAVIGAYFFWGYPISLLLTAIILIGGLFIFVPIVFSTALMRITDIIGFREKIKNIIEGIVGIPKNTLAICLFYRLAASVIDILQFYLLISAFVPIRFLEVATVYPIIILTNILPLTIGGIGIREGTSIITLARFGIPPEAAVNASFLLFCMNTLLPGLIGALFIPRIQLKRAKV